MAKIQQEVPNMVSRVIPVAPFDLVIFGGTGDLARRKTRPGVSNVAAAYLAERMTRIAQELRRTEAHIEKFKRGRDAGSPVSAADAVPLEALPDDELYARLEKLVGGLASADDGAGPVVGRTAGAEPDAVPGTGTPGPASTA